MRQVCIVPSGAQQWMREVFAAGGGRFAYVSTLAIYIYRLRGFVLEKILVGHEKMIKAIAWSPHDPRMLASASTDQVLKLWDVDTEQALMEIRGVGFDTLLMTWALTDAYSVLLAERGSLRLLDLKSKKTSKLKDFGKADTLVTSLDVSTRDRSKVAIGLSDCHVHIFQMQNLRVVKIQCASAIVDAVWDPRSENYLLVATVDGKIVMYDTEKEIKEVAVFARHAGGLTQLAWVPEIPGGFVTVSERSGVIKLWNVSQTAAVELLKTGKDGFHAILFVSADAALCCFKDGMVALYNVTRKQVEWSTEGGHTETIFDCAFCSTDPNILATASYDSTVRLWDIRTSKCTSKLLGAQGVLYSVAWSPDGSTLASSSSEGKVFLYDVAKQVVVKTIQTNRESVYRVAWNQRNPELIACASADNTCTITRTNGQLQRSLKHPKAVFGCAWSPFDTALLATGCQDGLVYVWSVTSQQGQDKPQRVLSGHTSKVFNVVWSPLLPDALISGSDDKTARVWSVSSGTSVVLAGHTSNVRGILWHSALPHLAITGSWDSTIRLWDVRTGVCVKVVGDHHADVYGVASHPSRPFVVATASRDTTIRLWSLDQAYKHLKIKAICEAPNVIAQTENAMATAEEALYGKAAVNMMAIVRQSASLTSKFAAIFDFFSLPAGTFEVWRLAGIVAQSGSYASSASAASALVPHRSEMLPCLLSRAIQLEAQVSSTHRQFMGAGRKEEVLNQAAVAHLKVGNVERYCELMSELGEWERAIAVAPAVSLELWRSLIKSYAQHLLQTNKGRLNEVLPWYIAINHPDTLINLYVSNELYDDAITLAQVSAEGGYSQLTSAGWSPCGTSNVAAATAPRPRTSRETQQQVHVIRGVMAEAHSQKGEASWAACCHLSIDDPHLAVTKLLRGHEVDLAVTLGWALKVRGMAQLTELLAKLCEAEGDWGLSFQLLRDQEKGGGSILSLQLAAARHLTVTGAGEQDVGQLFSQLSLQGCSRYREMAATEADPTTSTLYYVLACMPAKAVEVGVAYMKTVFSRPSWNMEELQPMIRVLECMQYDRLPPQTRDEVLAYLCYCGGIKAMFLGYYPIVAYLMERTRTLVRNAKLEFPVQLSLLSLQELHYKQWVEREEASRGLTEIATTDWVPQHLRQAADAINQFNQDHLSQDMQLLAMQDNVVVPTASSMPSGGHRGKQAVSVINAQPIVGPVHVLEDGASCISLAEAVMYSRVTAFSPLCNGLWIKVK